MNAESLAYFNRIAELNSLRTPFASVTMASSRGHAPQDPGAKIIVTAAGLDYGTVGGGRVEAKAIALAQEMLAGRGPASPQLLTWNLQRDVGMTCGGEVTIFIEVFAGHRWQIAVFGAGHVAQALVRLLIGLDCRVLCIDPRREWLDRLPEAPNLRKLPVEEMASAVAELPPDAYVMLMTQGHKFDMPILKAVLAAGSRPYVGVIGSDVKSIIVRKELREAGFAEDRVASVHCPMGLPFGTNAPNEIAISMVAEILQLRDQRDQRDELAKKSGP